MKPVDWIQVSSTAFTIICDKYGVVLNSATSSIGTLFQEQNIAFLCLILKGVRSLKNTYFKPRYILLVPMNKEKYEGHLRRKGLFSRPEIEEAVSRVDMYIRISQGFPGYFDAVVNTGKLISFIL